VSEAVMEDKGQGLVWQHFIEMLKVELSEARQQLQLAEQVSLGQIQAVLMQ